MHLYTLSEQSESLKSMELQSLHMIIVHDHAEFYIFF